MSLTSAYELAGVYVTSEAKRGKDAGELAGIAPLDVTATTNVDEMCRILSSGTNIVTPAGITTSAWR